MRSRDQFENNCEIIAHERFDANKKRMCNNIFDSQTFPVTVSGPESFPPQGESLSEFSGFSGPRTTQISQ